MHCRGQLQPTPRGQPRVTSPEIFRRRRDCGTICFPPPLPHPTDALDGPPLLSPQQETLMMMMLANHCTAGRAATWLANINCSTLNTISQM